MKFKLDENLGASVQKIFLEADHDCRTVREEKLVGVPDPEIFSAAKTEKRILLTMDHDFGNVLAFRHEVSAGVAVLNPPGRPSLPLLRVLAHTLLEALKSNDIDGHLWVIEPGRIREHQPPNIPGLEESK